MQLKNMKYFLIVLFTCAACSNTPVAKNDADPLPSWNQGANKDAIIRFVTAVTDQETTTFVPPPERIATFDNDGTLWSEQPIYFQLYFALEQVRTMAASHPEWATTEPFKSAIAGDMQGVMAGGQRALMQILAAAHSGMTAEEFAVSARRWAASARHPQTGMKFTEMVYQPMLELLDYLRANGFKTYIVSGGGIDFMRAFTEEVYGIPPEQVVGTTGKVSFSMDNGIPMISKEPEIALIDDKEGKPVGIYQYIGRRPLLAGGNSDGDLQMLQYTTIARDGEDSTPRLGIIIHHTDAQREYAYDRESHAGRLDQALDEAPQRGWLVIDMQKDWNRIYPPVSP